MKTSVIIPTYNEEKVILDCISSLLKQSVKDIEIILIDDGSKDRTIQILNNLNSKKVKLLQQKHKGPGAARNYGAAKAKGQVYVFVDADMTFDKEFVKNLTKPIIEGKAKGTFSKDELVSNWSNKMAKSWSINQNWALKKRHPSNYPNTQKVFRAILASEFIKVGGFTPGGYTDDWSLSKKLGYEAQNAKNALYYHKNPETLSESFTQAKWSSKREFKLGITGKIISLFKYSLPISFIIGATKSLKYKLPEFLAFKIIYDLGFSLGILESFINTKQNK